MTNRIAYLVRAFSVGLIFAGGAYIDITIRTWGGRIAGVALMAASLVIWLAMRDDQRTIEQQKIHIQGLQSIVNYYQAKQPEERDANVLPKPRDPGLT